MPPQGQPPPGFRPMPPAEVNFEDFLFASSFENPNRISFLTNTQEVFYLTFFTFLFVDPNQFLSISNYSLFRNPCSPHQRRSESRRRSSWKKRNLLQQHRLRLKPRRKHRHRLQLLQTNLHRDITGTGWCRMELWWEIVIFTHSFVVKKIEFWKDLWSSKSTFLRSKAQCQQPQNFVHSYNYLSKGAGNVHEDKHMHIYIYF